MAMLPCLLWRCGGARISSLGVVTVAGRWASIVLCAALIFALYGRVAVSSHAWVSGCLPLLLS